MRSKKLFALIAVVMILSMIMTGCKAKSNKLTVWIEWGDNPAQLQELFNKFGTANNVTVEVTAPVAADKYQTAMTGTTPPDILIMSGGDFVKSYAKDGLIEPLNDWISKAGIDLNDIFPAPLDQCNNNGTYYCQPWGTDIYALYYNKDLFIAAGLDPNKPPETMEQLVENADKLTVLDANGKITQIGFIPDYAWGHLDLYSRMFGGFWYSEDGQHTTLNSQAMVDAAKWEAQFYTKYGVDKMLDFASTLGEYATADFGFYTGKVAMFVDGEWEPGANFIQSYAPNLNYGIAAFPPPADHPERAMTAVVQGTVALIPKNSSNKELAAKLLAWMESPEIVAEEMYTNSNLPTSKKGAEDTRFTTIPNFQIFLDLIANKNATYIISTPISQQVNDELGTMEEQWLRAGGDPQALLDAAQAKYEPLLQDALK